MGEDEQVCPFSAVQAQHACQRLQHLIGGESAGLAYVRESYIADAARRLTTRK
jgi:hypothetical protein